MGPTFDLIIDQDGKLVPKLELLYAPFGYGREAYLWKQEQEGDPTIIYKRYHYSGYLHP